MQQFHILISLGSFNFDHRIYANPNLHIIMMPKADFLT